MEELQKLTTVILNNLKESDFWKSFSSWKQRWNSYMAAGGNYVEVEYSGSE
jgi:hypothetical protein